MGQKETLLSIAAKEVGYKEGSNNNSKYGKWYGMNNQPWCAMFVSWCAAQAKVPESVILKFAYVPYGVDFFKKQKRYHAANGSYQPQPGDIVFFGDSDHVGIVEKVGSTTITTIEGNTSSGNSGSQSNGDGVYRRTRDKKGGWTMGYGTPKYEEEDEEDMKRYDTIDEVPSWAKDTVEDFIAAGALQGNGKSLDLSEDMLRTLVIVDRYLDAQ